MRNISEMYEHSLGIQDIMQENQVDEGLKNMFDDVKNRLKGIVDKVVSFAKDIVAKIGVYFVPVGNDGQLLEAVATPTMGAAMKKGLINKESTAIALDNAAASLSGWKSKASDFKKLPAYQVKSLNWWNNMIHESAQNNNANINEVHLSNEDPESRYSTICDEKELKDEIIYHVEHPFEAPLLIWGAPGIGKTAIIDAVCKTLGGVGSSAEHWASICKTLSNETPDNFFLPDYVTINGEKDENGNPIRRATDVPKTWLPVYKKTGDKARDAEASAKLGKGLLFVDELSRATAQVQNVILPLINERRLGDGWTLGDGWVVIAATNRMEDDESAQTSLSTTLTNRFDQVWYEPTVKTWENWAKNQGFISPLLLQWLNMSNEDELAGGKFFYMDPNENYDDGRSSKLMCTPRSWTNAMRKLATFSHTGKLEGFDILDIPERVLQRALGGFIPASAIDSFCAFLNIIRSVGDFDAAVENVWKNGGSGFNIDNKTLNRVALPLAQLIICARDNSTLPSEKEFKSLTDWLISVKNDQLTSLVMDIFKNVYIPDSIQNKDEIFRIKYYLTEYVNKKLSDADWERSKEVLLKTVAQPLMDKYGIKSIADFPDYYHNGFVDLASTFRAAFSVQINGKDALG